MILRVAFICTAVLLSFVETSRADFLVQSPRLREETESTQRAILELLDYRMAAVREVDSLVKQVKARDAIRADQLESIHENVIARSEIKDALILKIAPYLDLVNKPSSVNTDEELYHYLMTLAVGYTLTDNYQDFVETIQNNSHLRHIANEPNTAYGKVKNLLRKTVKQFYSVRFHRPTLRGARRFDELPLKVDQKILADKDLEFFWKVIESSATFNYLKNQNDFETITYDIGFFFKKLFGAKKIFKDIIHGSLYGTVYALSKVFGNTAGVFQSRRGYLYEQKALEQHLLTLLQPGDVLLEKTPFRLTDKFIPGYWGHTAVWIGTEEEIKELGIWDHPKIAPIQDRIRAGKSILEALRPGVTSNTVGHFMDIDSMAILRRPNLTDDEKRAVIIRAAAEYEKRYDFGFDVENQVTIQCSELVRLTYSDIDFKLDRILGRFTMNPDSVAVAAIDGQFDIVKLIESGAFAFGDLRTEMKRMIKK